MNLYFNEAELLREYGQDIEILIEVIRVLEDDIPARLYKLVQALENANFKEVELQAHTMKGSFKLFYAVPLVNLCQQVEFSSKKEDAEILTPPLKKLRIFIPTS